MRPTTRFATAGGLATAALLLTGCATSATSAGDTADAGLTIVASTNVYGDIAAAVAGDLATVTSIITSAAQDPHSYEASAQDQLALSKADIVIENGGGYDPFIDTLLEASGAEPIVINASEVSGLLSGDEAEEDHAHDEGEGGAHSDEEGHEHIEGFNEHVWYSLHGVESLAAEIAHELGELDPENAAEYEANYEDFAAAVEELEVQAGEIRELAAGAAVAMTEPVPFYLLEEAGLENVTPSEFSEAVEEGTDVPPLVLQETLALVSDGNVRLLAYNEQTAGAETEQLREAAEAAGIAVVSFSETLPEGADYLSWMTDNLSAIRAALG